jgi:hypothetical protein
MPDISPESPFAVVTGAAVANLLYFHAPVMRMTSYVKRIIAHVWR